VPCLALLLQACGTLSTWEVSPQETAAAKGHFDDYVDRNARPLVEDGKTPGLVVGVLFPDGHTSFYSYGVTDKGGQKVGPDTLFAIGSLSKGFMAGICSTLVQDGKLSWSDDLGHLPPPLPPRSWQPIPRACRASQRLCAP